MSVDAGTAGAPLDRPVAIHLLVPGDWQQPTGGYTYDRRLVQALRDSGLVVQAHHIDGSWPWPDAGARQAAQDCLAGLPDAALLVVDGLALGALPTLAAAHAERLRLVALVHHPLHLETGLEAAARTALFQSEAAALRTVRLVVVTSPATVGDVAAMGVPTERIAVVEPGCDPTPGPLAPKPSGGPVRLLCVATLTPRKGHAALLDALAGLQRLDWTLHNVGSATRDAATAAALRAQALRLGLDDRVHWHGELPADALQAQYQAADLFVLASQHEGYGMVVAEALAWGLPVIASRAGALADTLPPEAGLGVPPGDTLALQLALQRLISDPAQRAELAAAAWRAGRQLPSWPQQAARFADVLGRLR